MIDPTDASVNVLHLDPVLDMRAASGLLREMLSRRGANLTLDGSKVERLGGQCLQVLLAAEAAWLSDGCLLTCVGQSDEFRSALQLFGVDRASSLSAQGSPA